MSPPCSGLKSKQNKKLAACFMLVSLLAYSSTLNMVTCSSETSIDFHHTTQHYIPEDRIHHNDHCENLKSCSIYVIYMLFDFTFRSNLPQNLLNQELYGGLVFLLIFLWYLLDIDILCTVTTVEVNYCETEPY